MQRINAEPTFTDASLVDLGGPRTSAFLQRCQDLIPWEELAGSIQHLFPDHPGAGRPFWPTDFGELSRAVTMLKCVMLQKWFGLSDPQAEEQLRDRISFRRFVGLSFDDGTPDETTFVNFRRTLRENGCASTLFDKVVLILNDKGLILKQGTIVDATIIDAPIGEKVKGEDGLERHTRDRCATFTKNHGTLRHGYKAHIATDTRGMITDWMFDTAKVHDSQHIDTLAADETLAVYADSGYSSKARRQRLADEGVTDRLVHKRVRGQQELTPEQKRHNTACSKVRAFVEHPRAWMVRQMGYVAVRYRGLSRNALDFSLTAIAYNFKRSFSLLGHALTPVPKAT